jgi:hypothetical protein
MRVKITHTACADKTLKWAWIETTIRGKTYEDIEKKFKAQHPYSTILSVVELAY